MGNYDVDSTGKIGRQTHVNVTGLMGQYTQVSVDLSSAEV